MWVMQRGCDWDDAWLGVMACWLVVLALGGNRKTGYEDEDEDADADADADEDEDEDAEQN